MNMETRSAIASIAAVLSVGIVGSLNASVLSFFGEDLGAGSTNPHPNADAARSTFLSHLHSPGTEGFEGFGAGSTSPWTLDFGSLGTAILSGSGQIEDNASGSFGRFPISGTKFWDVVNSSLFEIQFSNPVGAFGFYGTDIGDFPGQMTLTFSNGGSTEVNVPHTIHGPDGSVLYFGYIDTENPFTRIAFGSSGYVSDFFGIDEMTIASPDQIQPPIGTPEPGEWVLMITGMTGLFFCAWYRRRRQNSTFSPAEA